MFEDTKEVIKGRKSKKTDNIMVKRKGQPMILKKLKHYTEY